MEKNNKIVLGAVLILFIAMFSFSFASADNEITGRQTLSGRNLPSCKFLHSSNLPKFIGEDINQICGKAINRNYKPVAFQLRTELGESLDPSCTNIFGYVDHELFQELNPRYLTKFGVIVNPGEITQQCQHLPPYKYVVELERYYDGVLCCRN